MADTAPNTGPSGPNAARRVVVTGIGAVTPVGNTAADFWAGLMAGRVGVATIDRWDPKDHPCKIAAQVRGLDDDAHFDRKEARKFDFFTKYAVVAAREAFKQSGLAPEGDFAFEIGVILGVGMGGVITIEEQHEVMLAKGVRRVSPFLVPKMIPNMASGMVSIDLGLKGPNMVIATACASASHAIGESFRQIQRGDAVAIVTGGTESVITPLSIAGFGNMGALSTRNDDPATASRPFDAGLDGFVMGEGAGILVLEDLDHALARGASIIAEIVGYGLSGDAFHMTSPGPGGEGTARSMAMCLRSAGLKPEDVDYVNAHGTSTPLNDKLETQAIKSVFGDHARRLVISSIKGNIGHLIGAAGGVEAVASIMALREGMIPPTVNLTTPDPDCDLDYVPNTPRKADLRVAMSNNLGFGGQNATVAFRQWDG